MFQDQHKKLNITIATLSVLLAFSLTALVFLLIYNHQLQTKLSALTYVPDNNISASFTATRQAPSQPQLYAAPMKATRMSYTVPTAAVRQAVQTYAAAPHFTSYGAQGSDSEEILELYKKNPSVNEPFAVSNMFPGDRYIQNYCVRVHHKGALDIHFRSNIRDDAAYEKLAEVLMITVFVEGEERYDGLMRDMPQAITVRTANTSNNTTTEIDYSIAVYLDTSVGNDYKNKELVADFVWWTNVETPEPDDDDTDDPKPPVPPDVPDVPDIPDEPDTPSDPEDPTVTPDEPNPGGGTLVDPPQTGYELDDRTMMKIALAGACVFLFVSSAVLFFLILTNDKKEEEEDVR